MSLQDDIAVAAYLSMFDWKDYAHPDESRARKTWTAYYRHKFGVATMLQPKSILEIGVRAGYSATAFMLASPLCRLYRGIDPDGGTWGGTGKFAHWAAEQLGERFPDVNLQLLFAGSQTAEATSWAADHGPYDLVHVDGDHSYNGTMADLNLAWAVTAPGGWVYVDDYCSPPGNPGFPARTATQNWADGREIVEVGIGALGPDHGGCALIRKE